MKRRIFKITGIQRIREGTYKFQIDTGRDGELHVVVYPRPLPMLVLGPDGPLLESDITERQQTKLRMMVQRLALEH